MMSVLNMNIMLNVFMLSVMAPKKDVVKLSCILFSGQNFKNLIYKFLVE
jgi:hypothetical protein